VFRRTSKTGAFSSAEDAFSPRSFFDLEEDSPNNDLASDILIVTGRHARVGIRIRPIRSLLECASTRRPCGRRTSTWRKPASQRTLRRRTREGMTTIRPRTPSVVLETTSRLSASSRAVRSGTFGTCAPTHPFALSPLAPRVSGVTSFLQAERPARHETLRSPDDVPREMRPTDVCHPIERRAPVPRALPEPLATFAARVPSGE